MAHRILVLGASGNIGSHLTQYLKDENADFVGGVPQSELSILEDKGVKGTAINFDDRLSLETAMSGVERLFMLLPMHEKMQVWAKHILNAAEKAPISFIVRSSLQDASPDSDYALYRTHGMIDHMVRRSGIPYAIIRPNSFMQNFMHVSRDQIIKDNAVYFSEGNPRVSFTDVRDIARAAQVILHDPSGHQNREYDITGPEALSMRQAAEIFSTILNRQVNYILLTELLYEANLRSAGLSEWQVQAMMSVERHMRDGLSGRVSNDFEKITGRKPISFGQFVRDFANVWQAVPAGV